MIAQETVFMLARCTARGDETVVRIIQCFGVCISNEFYLMKFASAIAAPAAVFMLQH